MKGINMNKQERKECQYSDYYRMTGEGEHTGLRCLKNLFLFHHLAFMYWYRKCQQKSTFFRRYILYRMSRKFGLEISTKATIGICIKGVQLAVLIEEMQVYRKWETVYLSESMQQ